MKICMTLILKTTKVLLREMKKDLNKWIMFIHLKTKLSLNWTTWSIQSLRRLKQTFVEIDKMIKNFYETKHQNSQCNLESQRTKP